MIYIYTMTYENLVLSGLNISPQTMNMNIYNMYNVWQLPSARQAS
jgi:hypothetical protein